MPTRTCFRFGEHPFNSKLNLSFSPALEYGLFKFADVLKSKCKDNRITDVKLIGERHEEKGRLMDNPVQH
jgi:hypothetical protein